MLTGVQTTRMSHDELEHVFVAGASGGTGMEVLRLLGPRSPRVTALTSSPANREQLLTAGADTVVVTDLLSPEGLEADLRNVDAVISAVGSGFTDVWTADELVDGTGVQTLLSAAESAGVDAFVMESAVGVGDDPASGLATLFNLAIAPVQRAKATTERLLRESSLSHTIFRPGVLTNGPRTDSVTVADPGSKLYGTVSRADIARLLITAPITPEAANATFEVVSTPSFPERGLTIDWQLPGSTPSVASEN
ncbi:MAG: NADH(P)-binding protein [uncultured archaeon A07HR60]|nr:MAG: NADH(P)-binding protein [uncultured archaeon A07HR60]